MRNRLNAATLSTLLDDRKFATSRSDLDRLAARYTVDVSILERLAGFVNSPSIGEGTVVRTVSDDGQEKVTMQVCQVTESPFFYDLNDLNFRQFGWSLQCQTTVQLVNTQTWQSLETRISGDTNTASATRQIGP